MVGAVVVVVGAVLVVGVRVDEVVLDVDEVTDVLAEVVESPIDSTVGTAVAHAASSNIRAASRVINVMMTTPRIKEGRYLLVCPTTKARMAPPTAPQTRENPSPTA